MLMYKKILKDDGQHAMPLTSGGILQVNEKASNYERQTFLELEFGQTWRGIEGQRSLACYSPWGHKESDATQQLSNYNNWNISRDTLMGISKTCL